MAWLRKLIFACVSKATQTGEVVASMLRKQVHHIQGEICSSKIKRYLLSFLNPGEITHIKKSKHSETQHLPKWENYSGVKLFTMGILLITCELVYF